VIAKKQVYRRQMSVIAKKQISVIAKKQEGSNKAGNQTYRPQLWTHKWKTLGMGEVGMGCKLCVWMLCMFRQSNEVGAGGEWDQQR